MRSHRRRPSGSAAVVSKHHRVSCLIWIFQLASDVLHWQPERLAWGTTVVKMIRRGAAILAVLALAACGGGASLGDDGSGGRSEEHTSELQSLMRISYAVFCLKKKNDINNNIALITQHSRKPM